LLDILLESREHEHLKEVINNHAIVAEALLFLLAGAETTSNTLAFLIYALAYYPHVQEKLYHEIMSTIGDKIDNYEDMYKCEYLVNVVKEVMRISPTAPGAGRTMEKDTQIGPYLIPKGHAVVCSFVRIQKDPDNFDNPEEFIPERFENFDNKNKSFLPFGGGKRICIGKSFALLELYTVVTILVKKFKFSHPNPDTPWPIPYCQKFTLQPLYFDIKIEKRD